MACCRTRGYSSLRCRICTTSARRVVGHIGNERSSVKFTCIVRGRLTTFRCFLSQGCLRFRLLARARMGVCAKGKGTSRKSFGVSRLELVREFPSRFSPSGCQGLMRRGNRSTIRTRAMIMAGDSCVIRHLLKSKRLYGVDNTSLSNHSPKCSSIGCAFPKRKRGLICKYVYQGNRRLDRRKGSFLKFIGRELRVSKG